MIGPFPYSDKELLEVSGIPGDQSIFTSKYFRSMAFLLEKMNFRSLDWNYTDADLLHWINSNCQIMSGAYTGVDTVIEGHSFRIDNTNFALIKASYATSAEGEKMPNYFPTPELVDALVGTELRWIDAEVFKTLPDAFTIRMPTPNQFRILMGDGWHSFDDVILMRAKVPFMKRHLFHSHGEADPDPSWEAFYWLGQSRSELAEGIQNTVFGSFIIKENTKLEDLLQCLELWSRGTDDTLRVELAKNHAVDTLDRTAKFGTTEFQRTNAEYFKSALESRINYSEEGYQTYMEALKFIIKFAILMNTEQFCTQIQPIPGQKPGKISKKAHEIRQKLLWKWGKRYKVVLPRVENPENEPENLGGTHKTPIKHWVMGFFRNQVYGPGRSLRKIKWIPGFWRGSDQLKA